MTRTLAAIAAVLAVVAGVVALWILSSAVAVMVYRHSQIAFHRCLSELPKPVGHVTVGVVAASAFALFALLVLLRPPARRRTTVAWPVAAYATVITPLLVAGVLLASADESFGPVTQSTCTSIEDQDTT